MIGNLNKAEDGQTVKNIIEIKVKKVNSIEEYFQVNSHFTEALDVLRQIINSTELEETLKWNSPVYKLDGKLVLGLGAFKKHFCIWFFNGAFLKDKCDLLVKGSEKTKALTNAF